MTKRMLSLLLALVMTLSLCVPALAADEFEAETVTEVEEQAPEAPVEPEAPEAEVVEEPVAEETVEAPEVAAVIEEPADAPMPAVTGVDDTAVAALQAAIEAATAKKAAATNNELHDAGKEGAKDFLGTLEDAEDAMDDIVSGNVAANWNTALVNELAKTLEALTKALTDVALPSQELWFSGTNPIVSELGLTAKLSNETGINPGYYVGGGSGKNDSWGYPTVDTDVNLAKKNVTTDKEWTRAYSADYLTKLQAVITDALDLVEAFASDNVVVTYKQAQDVIDRIVAVTRGNGGFSSTTDKANLKTSTAYANAKKITTVAEGYDALQAAYTKAENAVKAYNADKSAYFQTPANKLITNNWTVARDGGRNLYGLNAPSSVVADKELWLANTMKAYNGATDAKGFVDVNGVGMVYADYAQKLVINRRVYDLEEFAKALDGLKIKNTAKFTTPVLPAYAVDNNTINNRRVVNSITLNVEKKAYDGVQKDEANTKGEKFYVYGYTVQELNGNVVARRFAATTPRTFDKAYLSADYTNVSAQIFDESAWDSDTITIYPIKADDGTVKISGEHFKGGETIVVSIYKAVFGEVTTGHQNYDIDPVPVDTYTIKLDQDLYTGPKMISGKSTDAVASQKTVPSYVPGTGIAATGSEDSFFVALDRAPSIAAPANAEHIQIQVNDVTDGGTYNANYVLESHSMGGTGYTAGHAIRVSTTASVPIAAGDISIAYVSDECETTGHVASATSHTYFLRGAVTVTVPSIKTIGSEKYRTGYYEFEDIVAKAKTMLDGNYVAKPETKMTTAQAKEILKVNYDKAKAFVDAAATYGNCLYYRTLMDTLQKNLKTNMDNLRKGIDKTELEAAIAKAKALTEADYTAETWAAVKTALAAAEAVDADTTLSADVEADEKEVKDATDTLNNAMTALVKKGSDLVDLEAAIADAEKLVASKADYTTETWTAFETALSAAKTVAADKKATAADIEKALTDLKAAQTALKKTELAEAKEALADAEEKAEALTEANYTAESWAELKKALDNAEKLADTATAAEIEAAAKAIEDAIKGLVEKTTTPEKPEIPAAPASGTGWVHAKDGTWYYYKDKALQKSKWIYGKGGLWYYVGPDGDMWTGFRKIGNAWFMLQTSDKGGVQGKLLSGWISDPAVPGTDAYARTDRNSGHFGEITWTAANGDFVNGHFTKGDPAA